MPVPAPTLAAVDERVRLLIAEAGGSVRLVNVQNALSPQRRQLLPDLLASGAYEVEPRNGVVFLKLREGRR